MMAKETDLYGPVKAFLEAQGYLVKGEVNGCDVVAVRGLESPVIVELKQSFSLSLVFQAIARQALTNQVYLAIGLPKGSSPNSLWNRHRADLFKLCRMLGLGLLTVHQYGSRTGQVEPHLDPVSYRPRHDKKKRDLLLKEFHQRRGDPNRGGVSRQPIMTSYRQQSLQCAYMLEQLGPLKASRLKDMAELPNAAKIVQHNVYGWFERIDRGIYQLSPRGYEALRSGDGLSGSRIPSKALPSG